MNRVCPSCNQTFSSDVAYCGFCGTITVEPQDPANPDTRIGQVLGDYVVVARVADGAMGRVYEGRHRTTRARVAIKILHPNVATDAVAVERFRREYETAEMLAHPNIVKVIALGTTADGANYMVMEFLEGEELGKVLKRDGALPPARMLRILSQTGLALDNAHSFGVVHRDLKPDNLFLCASPEGDVVRILDFGSVKLQVETGPKLTAFGTTLGSPYYMSPEQAMGRPDVDHRTDVFALAAIASEMATGKVAFDGANVAEILMKIVQQQPVPPSALNPRYPHSFDDVVEAGIAKQKQERIGSASELANRAIAAFGLHGDATTWSAAPVSSLESALASARPPASVPFGGAAASAMHKSEPPPATAVVPTAGANPSLRLAFALGVCVVLLLGIVAILVR